MRTDPTNGLHWRTKLKVTHVDLPATIIHGPADDMHVRSAGLHLSDIYNSLDIELNGPKSKTPMLLSQLEVYRAAGFVWEHVFNDMLASAIELGGEWTRPGEVRMDGVIASPDLIHPDLWMLGETKLTWKSSRALKELTDTGTGKLWIWLVQMKGYCHMLNMSRARLFSFFVNGDYSNMQPQFHVNDFEFTPREIKENWDMLMSHARRKKWL